MAPSDYVQCRESKNPAIIDNKPYDPNIFVDITKPSSIIKVVIALLFFPNQHDETGIEGLENKLKVRSVTGGITNTLFCISGLAPLQNFDCVLVRVFGAEGLVDRDVETATFAALEGVAPPYYGRFGNGRIEGWLENYLPLEVTDLQDMHTCEAIAVQMAKLHYEFKIPPDLHEYHNDKDPGLWRQIFSWMEQALSIKEYKRKEDKERAEKLELPLIEKDLNWLKNDVVPSDVKVSFCHNDLLAANIMRNTEGKIHLIDFEYGGINYVSFDIANHFNEFAGGTSTEENGVPNYELFPSHEVQIAFITAYVKTLKCSGEKDEDEKKSSVDEEVSFILNEVKAFDLVNHLYWGLWAVNQAAVEGTEEFDYLEYARNRFARYWHCKRKNGF